MRFVIRSSRLLKCSRFYTNSKTVNWILRLRMHRWIIEQENLVQEKLGVCIPFVVCRDKRIRTWIFKNKRNKEWQAITFVIFKFCNLFHVQCFKTTTGNNQSIPQMYHTKARFMRKSVVHQYPSVINCLPYD